MALITQDDIEKTLHIQFGSSPDPVADWLIENSQAMVETYCKRTFEEETGVVETLDGNDRHTLWLSKFPVTGVTSVVEKGTTLDSSQYVWYPNGRLVRQSVGYDHPWPLKRQSVVVTYDGGFATIPFDLRMAVAAVAAEGFKIGAAYAEQKSPGINLERIGDYMVQYDLDRAMAGMRIPEGAKRLLNHYRRVIVV